MATGDDLIDRGCLVAKLNATAASADRVFFLSCLQEAADRIALEAEIKSVQGLSVTLTEGDGEYTVGTAPFTVTDLIAINTVRITDGSVTSTPIDQVTLEELNDMRAGAGQANGTPYVYAVSYPYFYLYPEPGTGASLDIEYVADAPTLADNASAITFIPKAFHWGCLWTLAMYHAMKYKKQPDANDYLTMYLEDRTAGLPALRRWKSRVGGRKRPVPYVDGVLLSSPSQDLGPFV